MGLRKLSDLPDDDGDEAPKPKKSRVRADDLVAVVNAVAKGMPCESAVNILCSLGMPEESARKMCDPAKASYEKATAPVAPVNHVHVPKDAIRVEMGSMPAPVIHVAPADVTVHEAPEKESCAYVHTVKRNSMGRIESILSQPA